MKIEGSVRQCARWYVAVLFAFAMALGGCSGEDSKDTSIPLETEGTQDTPSDSVSEGTSEDDSDASASVVEPTGSATVAYGPRTLKLLTREEYQNSLEDLVGIDFKVSQTVPFDTLVEGYFNNAFTPVTENHADAYLAVAEEVAAWSAERNFQGVVDCGFGENDTSELTDEACENAFFDTFGTRVFRRPLTADERTLYSGLFDDGLNGGDIKKGLELGMMALLTAPQFLYRSEVGRPVTELLTVANGTTVNGADFQTKSTGGADGTGWNIWSEGYIQNGFELSDQAQLILKMKGEDAASIWPRMELAVDGTVVASQTVNSAVYRDYTFDIDGYSGLHQIQIRFTNDYYQDGADRNLYVKSATIAGTSQSDANLVNGIDMMTLSPEAYVLDDYEMAAFLSYTLTGSTPDDTLLEAAEEGALKSAEQQREQIARLLTTDRAREHMGVFASQWLGSNEIINAQKDTTMFPDFTDEVRVSMAAEAKAFFTHVFYDPEQGFSDLFRADYVLVNNPLASYYGLGSVGTESTDPQDFVKVDASGVHRGGLMTLGSFLANEADLTKSSPIKRAANTRIRILCQDIPQPDETIPDLRTEKMEQLLAELDGKTVTTREFIGTITKETPCSFCHDTIINPLGFAYEDYDASGRYITTDHNGLTIDSSGRLIGINAIDDEESIALTGGKDLSNKFADLEAVKTCFSANAFRFALDIGHDAIDASNANVGYLTEEELEDYAGAVNTLSETLAESDSMAELFTRLGTLDLVRFRKQRDR